MKLRTSTSTNPRRLFLQKSMLALPALASLSACGGGAAGSSTASMAAVPTPGSAGVGAPSSPATVASIPVPAASSPTSPTLPTPPASTPATSASTPSVPPVVSADPSSGLTQQGTALINFSPLAKPAKLQTVIDPDFGNKITRITDAKGDWNSAFAIPAYPTTQAWNCDESLMILYVSGSLGTGGHDDSFALMDGKSYKFITFLNINPADVEQWYWSTTDPTALFYVDNNQRSGTQANALTKATITAATKDTSGTITSVNMTTTVLHDFANDFKSGGALYNAVKGNGPITLVSGGEDPFAMSEDNDLIGLGAYLNKNGPGGSAAYAAFSYRISTNTIGQSFVVEADVPQAMPSGRQTYFYKNVTAVYTMNPVTNAVAQTLSYDGTQHSDMLRNAAGDDVVAGPQFDGPGTNATLLVQNLTQGGAPKVIIPDYPPSGTLLSGRAYKVPGWVGMAMIGCPSGTNGTCNTTNQAVAASQPKTYLDQEVLIANVDTGAVYRVAHHRSTGNYGNSSSSNYWAQPNVTMSPSGTRILFQSDWGAANPKSITMPNGNAIVDTYVIELPAYQPT